MAIEKLFITGVTGYIGFKTLITALERGHHVRAVIRSERSVAELKKISSLVVDRLETGVLEFVVVPDLLQAEVIRKSLEGITAVVHLASPLAVEADDYEVSMIGPAISMVKVVLEAASTVDTIRRVVITSSCVTLIPFEWNFAPDSERLYTSDDINRNPTRPFSNGAMEAYWASKAFARIATLDFIKENKPKFDVINLLPSVVFGPDERILKDGKAAELVKEARKAVLAPALTSSESSPFPYVGVPVNVSDVARAHIDAATNSSIPGNTEYILSSDTPDGVVWERDIHALAHKYFQAEIDSGALPLQGSLAAIKWRLDGTKTEEAFGWKFTNFEETMRQLIAQYLELAKN